MNIIYARQTLPKSIFLVGPTPRSKEVKSWRPEAAEILNNLGFTGTVFIPENANWGPKDSYDDQVFWEWEALDQATTIACWIPRDLINMPAFTTNVEFGLYAKSGKLVLGYPREAPKMHYLNYLAQRYHVPVCHTLEETMTIAMNQCHYPYGIHH